MDGEQQVRVVVPLLDDHVDAVIQSLTQGGTVRRNGSTDSSAEGAQIKFAVWLISQFEGALC